MMSKKLGVILCVGLPGSGKTHFLKSNYSELRFSFSEDDYYTLEDESEADAIRRSIRCGVRHKFQCLRHYGKAELTIIDCLITTNTELNDIINLIHKESVKEGVDSDVIYTIHFWKENRDLCLHNDRGRKREKSSEISIKNLPLEYPVINNKDIVYNVIEHDVIKAPSLNIYFNKFRDRYKNDYVMTSQSWSAGGTWGNCWGNSGTISPDPVPQSFQEFDDMLTELCPNINFLTYKKLYNETVTVEEECESDYYGGAEYRHYYKCDLEKLHEIMTDLKLLENGRED